MSISAKYARACWLGLSLLLLVKGGVAMAAEDLQAKGAEARRERLLADLKDARTAIGASRLSPADIQGLLDQATALEREIAALPAQLPAGFKTIMPFSDLQARIFALHAPVRREAGFAPLVAWVPNRWDPLMPTEAPPFPPAVKAQLRLDMARGEHRAAALNLTNSGEQTLTVTLNVKGLPHGDDPVWVSVREVQFTDTYVRRPIAAALPLAPKTAAGYTVTIPVGMTRQVWLAADSRDVPAGLHAGSLTLKAADLPLQTIPFAVRIYPVDLPEPDLALGGWDYTQHPTTAYDAGALDQKLFIAKLREYGVNLPWTDPIIKGAEFDAEDRMVKPPDFSIFDAWVAKWPGAKYYAFFGLSEDLYGPAPGSPSFKRRVAQWVQAFVARAKTHGIEPRQMLLLLVDEPLKPEQDAAFIPWAEAVREANTGVQIWEDPCHEDPAVVTPRLYELCDILSPSGARFIGSPQSYRDFFVNQQRAGKELWFYNCVNGKHLDPITYHRGTFWLAIRYGAKGVGFWAFGDEGRGGNSFMAYTAPGHMFSPLFLDPPNIVDGKHMEAIREGREDFALFQLLRQRVAELTAKGGGGDDLAAARQLLTEGPERVAREVTIDRLDWHVPKERGTMDEVRIEALEALTKLAGK